MRTQSKSFFNFLKKPVKDNKQSNETENNSNNGKSKEDSNSSSNNNSSSSSNSQSILSLTEAGKYVENKVK